MLWYFVVLNNLAKNARALKSLRTHDKAEGRLCQQGGEAAIPARDIVSMILNP